jgi:hypothetical protein
MSALASSWMAPTAGRAIGASVTGARCGGASRTCSPSCCRGRSPGTGPASTASDRSSGAKVRRRRATTSSSLVGSPRRVMRSVSGTATCRPRALPELGRGVSASTPRPARCASPPTASLSPTGSSCSRRCCSSVSARPPGRPRGRCCSTTCRSGSAPRTSVASDPRWMGRLRRLLRGRIPRRQATAVARGGLLERPAGELERLLGHASR